MEGVGRLPGRRRATRSRRCHLRVRRNKFELVCGLATNSTDGNHPTPDADGELSKTYPVAPDNNMCKTYLVTDHLTARYEVLTSATSAFMISTT